MLPDYFAFVSAVIVSLGGSYYLYETLSGKAQPNRVTWLLWGLLPAIIFVAQRAQGVEGLSWVTFAAGATPFLIVLASFVNKKAYWKTQRRDYIVMTAALSGIGLWAITDNPNLAIVFSIAADFFAGLPTLLKSIKHPESESWVAFAISACGFAIGVLAIQTYTFENIAFVGYLFCMEAVLAFFASRKRQVAARS